MAEETKKILIVEDEDPMRKALVDRLKQEGYEIAEARDGVEGLDAVEADGIDLVLLDIILPKMDGMTMLKKMRETEKGKDLPVLLLTNLDYSVGVAKAIESGAYDYLVKSDWTLDDVAGKVNDKLRG